jgi:antitoxin component YwqK of YwqJK toxin-antitoxin module
MDHLITACSEYISNPKYVFKSCGNYIVVLEKLCYTKTNESRSNIADPKYAKYRANKLKTILIINKFDPSDVITEIQNSFHTEKKVVYRTNEIIKIYTYDYDLDVVCTRGIHYFRTIEQSFFWELLKFNPTFTGKFIQWHENGNKEFEGEYKEGKMEGIWIEWHANGTKLNEGEYKEGKEEGKWIQWCENGTKCLEGEFKGGKMEGKWIHSYKDGKIKIEEEYKEGKREGKWIKWDYNGFKVIEGEYKEGNFFERPILHKKK